MRSPVSLRGFSGKRLGNVYGPESLFKVLVMEGFHCLDLRLPLVPQVPGRHARPALTALAAPDITEVLAAVHVLAA
jgi:hypothetical protein